MRPIVFGYNEWTKVCLYLQQHFPYMEDEGQHFNKLAKKEKETVNICRSVFGWWHHICHLCISNDSGTTGKLRHLFSKDVPFARISIYWISGEVAEVESREKHLRLFSRWLWVVFFSVVWMAQLLCCALCFIYILMYWTTIRCIGCWVGSSAVTTVLN